jgi:hypothetical protein
MNQYKPFENYLEKRLQISHLNLILIYCKIIKYLIILILTHWMDVCEI